MLASPMSEAPSHSDPGEDSPAGQALQQILLEAMTMNASDVHLEPHGNGLRVRLRVDGQLLDRSSPASGIGDRLISRIKVMSRLDIAQRRLPQDGRLQISLAGRSVSVRVSTLPTIAGEKLVLRWIQSHGQQLTLAQLGCDEKQLQGLRHSLAQPHGMVLVTGPTGAGKTMTLYACLQALHAPHVNLCTVEDPVEVELAGINQVQVHDKAGLTFSTALRAFLRQDPDVIMVGEIRDTLTAETAFRAAQTGHLVLTSLHTNDAASTLVRLMQMGVATFHLASSVLAITAQRLARRLCDACKAPAVYPTEQLRHVGFSEHDLSCLGSQWHPFKAIGCSACINGYRGRIGLFEVLPMSASLQPLILEAASLARIRQQARLEGVSDLRHSALQRVRQGMCSIEEVLCVTTTE